MTWYAAELLTRISVWGSPDDSLQDCLGHVNEGDVVFFCCEGPADRFLADDRVGYVKCLTPKHGFGWILCVVILRSSDLHEVTL